MQARGRKPTIRRVRDWEPPVSPSAAPVISAAISSSLSSSPLRAPRVPLDLVRPTPQAMPIARIYVEENDDEEDEMKTLARFVPINSEIRALLDGDDLEETLAYMRKVQASIPDEDAALDSLVAVYEERVARLQKEREHAAAIIAQAKVVAEEPRRPVKPKTTPKPLDRALVKLQPHFWKIIYSTICVWGLLQLALTR